MMTSMMQDVFRKNPYIVSLKEIVFSSKLRDLLKEKLTPEYLRLAEANKNKVRVYQIGYKSNGHVVMGFLVIPRKKTGKLPCIIHNRGGSNDFGSIKVGKVFTDLATMASWGYVVIASQYSGNAGSEGKDEFGGKDLLDVLRLHDVLKYVVCADISRIGMEGASRGGMMTYMCLAKVKWIKAAVIRAGLSDLFRNERLRPEMRENFKGMFGGSRNEKRKRSALFWTDKFSKKVPILLMHGTADWRVSPLDSLELSEKLIKNLVPHRLIIFEGGDHGLMEFITERFAYTKEWFDKFVKDGVELPNLKPHGK